MITKHSNTRIIFFSFFSSSLAFAFVNDPRILDFRFDDWLYISGDSQSEYAAWMYFKDTHLFQWPLTENYGYGGSWGRTIIFSAVPVILALPLKALLKLAEYDGVFQYQGIQLIMSFFLIIFFCIKLALREGIGFAKGSVLALLVTLSPYFLFRESFPHYTFGIFWVIPASIYYFQQSLSDRDKKGYAFPILIFVSLNWMPYFALFPLSLWLYLKFRSVFIQKKIRHRIYSDLIEGLFVSIAVASFFVLNGIRTFNGSGDAGVGECNANLLAPINSRSSDLINWSRVLPGFGTSTNCQYEGFGYVGTGTLMIALLLGGVYLISSNQRKAMNKRLRQLRSLILMSIIMFCFSTGGSLALGTMEIFEMDLEGWPLFSTFRATGRYMLFVSFVTVLITTLLVGSIFSHKVSLIVMIAALIVSVFDSYPAIKTIRSNQDIKWVASKPISELFDTVNPSRVIFVEPEPSAYFWKMEIILESAKRGIPVNDGFIARSVPTELQYARQIALNEFSKQDGLSTSLYILYPDFIARNRQQINEIIGKRCISQLRDGAIAVWSINCPLTERIS